jgi:hypothetical protein
VRRRQTHFQKEGIHYDRQKETLYRKFSNNRVSRYGGNDSMAASTCIWRRRCPAEAAAPSSLSKKATILDRNGNELRKGTNGWTCIPDNPGTPETGPLCMNQSWLHFREALKHQQPPADTQVGIAYMLQGGISASNRDPHSFGPHLGNDRVDGLGAHIMISVPDPAILKDLPTSSKNGGPWVMWADTPYAHLVLPIQSLPSQ